MSAVSKEKQIAELEKLYPEVAPKFRALREFQYYILNNWLITFFVLTTIGTAKATVIVSILVLRMYKTLNDNASQISSKTLAKHKTALKSLIMQFMTTPISFFPAFVVLLSVLIPTEYSQIMRMYKTLKENQSRLSSATIARHQTALKSLIMQFMTTPISFFPAFVVLLTVLIPTEYSQKISWWSLMIGTTHSTLNSIVVIITYSEIRNALFFWRRNPKKVSTLISSMRPSGV
ncbi:hypothetical protein L5515_015214 [Caenorhabditis briggsae]|uniref:Uncharacterized protein n=1 Tax=Caenorhabditis briggsae TaxID=6238 RepID=A0AAE9EE49_CAEBR|nr:hypothetical protein L5515_015214 [Caenorhabditis briggsae]